MSADSYTSADYHRLLQEALTKIRELRAENASLRERRAEPIAIVGAGCRMPGGADSPAAFWRMLVEGRDAVTRVPAERWDADAFYDADPATPGKMCVREGCFLDRVDAFDANFFGIPPREARQLDPQQRLLLEVSWEALENAAIAADALRGSTTGVYVGVMGADYAFRQAHGIDTRAIDPYMLSGNDLSFTAGRVAYYLGLHGPALAVATACSSSLVSIHLAAQALNSRECDLALAGGVNVILDPVTGIMLSTLRALAPDGRSKTFDASADGYGRGEGCGVLVLERLSDALRNGRRIVAVIRGSAMSHDGASAGLTVPNGVAQGRVIRAALAAAGVDAREIDYVEAHGTGTALGDPIEVQSLARVMSAGRTRDLLIGSVKTNVGHLEAAAGVAGVLKTALALEHAQVPPHLHMNVPSPRIAWNEIPIKVPMVTTPWPSSEDTPRRAGVSSFGLSGINAHIVLEAAPPRASQSETANTPCVLTLSARTATALEALRERYIVALAAHPEWNWADVCYTSNVGRVHFEHRLAVTASTLTESLSALRRGARSAPDAKTLAGQYLGGVAIDWAAHHRQSGVTRNCVELPTYPFERERYWALNEAQPSVAPGTVADCGEDLARQLRALHGEQRRARVTQELSHRVAAALGVSTASVDASRSLSELGLDSLMTVEIRAWLRSALGVELSLEQLHGASNVDAIATDVCSRFDVPELPSNVVSIADATVENVRYPLSRGQAALWFIHASAPESAAYNVGVALRINAALDMDRMERAINAVVARHDELRVRFESPSGGELEQVVEAAAPIALERIDASGWDDAKLRGSIEQAHRRPFRLDCAPLLRASIFVRNGRECVLLLSLHHIVCDAQSVWAMLDELQAAYAGHALKPAHTTYAEFVRWQSEMLRGEAGDRLWAYWQRELAGELPVLNLPTDCPRPIVQSFQGSSHALRIDAERTRRLRELARSSGATLHSTLLSAYATLLSRYCGQSEVIVGCATSGRPADFAGVVGYFTNPIPIRIALDNETPYRELLAQVRRKIFDGIEHEQMPFALLVERLQPRRDASRPPLYQADFSLLRPPTAHRGAAPLAFPMVPYEFAEEEGQFDIGLHVVELEHELNAVFKFDASLFLPETIARMAECFLTLLDAALANPECAIGALPLLSVEARHRELYVENQTQVRYDTTPVYRLFEAQVQRTPDAVAAEMYGGATLRYTELNQRANRWARRLRALGVGAESLVGICLERSLDLVVAILATLKAGAAYVPLDPSYPARRLSFMLSDAGARVLLTDSVLHKRLDVPDTVRAIEMDVERDSVDALADSDLDIDVDATNLAYVIYTSGSTGQPKGTLIEHRGLTNYLQWCVDAYGVGQGCGAPVSTAIGFDATITSLFAPLLTGGRVVLLPEDRTIEALAECLRNGQNYSLIKITPAHLEILGEQLAPHECAQRARVFVIGGEALRGDMLAYWRKHAPETRLINEYGPTETVVGCCVYDAREAVPGAVPIGKPIANTELYVLDERMQPVPRGVVGELYIGGVGVARGYLNRDELTAKKFVADPFSGREGARLFRTGDLVRRLNDGNLEFLGRIDSQVKIRGYRIELEEIESVLAGCAGIERAAVAASDGQLAAYYCGNGAVPEVAAIRRHLEERLPSHMVPSFLMRLDNLPLTPNGKVDRGALPAAFTSRNARAIVAPREPLELKIASVWTRVLGTTDIGVTDNFFDLGGHSLLAVRLAAMLERVTGRRVPLSTVLRAPTIEQQALALRRETAPVAHSPLVPIQTGGSRAPLYCVPGAGGNVIYLYSLARALGPDQPFYGLQGRGFEGEAPPHSAVEEMAAYYLSAVESQHGDGPYVLGGHSLGGWVAYEMAQQLVQRGKNVQLVAIIDTPVPYAALRRDTSDWSEARWMVELANRIGPLLNPDLHVPLEELEARHGEEQFAYFRDALVQAGLFPQEAAPDQIRNVLSMFKAHTQVRYRIPEKPLPVQVALFRTAVAPPGRADDGDESWGWSAIAQTEVHMVPGEHLTTLRAPHVEHLAAKLSQCLEAAHSDAPTLRGRAARC